MQTSQNAVRQLRNLLHTYRSQILLEAYRRQYNMKAASLGANTPEPLTQTRRQNGIIEAITRAEARFSRYLWEYQKGGYITGRGKLW
jgi:hypothetical protein